MAHGDRLSKGHGRNTDCGICGRSAAREWLLCADRPRYVAMSIVRLVGY
jgi:hypothetical protein